MSPNEEIGKRIRLLRMLTGRNRREFCAEFHLVEYTIASIEVGRLKLSQKKLEELLKIFSSEGVVVSSQWILTGEGSSPHKEGRDSDPSQVSENSISETMGDDSMSPLFDKGDFLGGLFCEFNEVLSGEKCILQFDDGNRKVCMVHKVGDQYISQVINFLGKELQFVPINEKTTKVAKITWYRKKF